MKEPKTSYIEKMILSEEEKAVAIRKEVIRLSQISLSDWDKKVADKAAKLIARDYGETLRRLAEEDKEDAKYRKKIVK